MEEVDDLIKTLSKKIEKDINIGRNIGNVTENVTALAELIKARAATVDFFN
jgi:hypothetical protein